MGTGQLLAVPRLSLGSGENRTLISVVVAFAAATATEDLPLLAAPTLE